MTKYIVKNCPGLINDDVVENGYHQRQCHNKDFFCKDRTDCLMKKMVEICQEKWNKLYDPMAKIILQALDVQEVE